MMAVHIQSLWIESFRGIKKLKAAELNHVNLIVGDNNCGKTSVLEALLLLRNPKDLANILRIARQRDPLWLVSRTSIYENFINLFPKSILQNVIKIEALCHSGLIKYSIHGDQKKILLDEGDLPQLNYSYAERKDSNLPSESDAFVGVMEYCIGDAHHTEDIKLHEFSRISGLEIRRNYLLDMVYLSPIDHMKSSIINYIIRNDGYKEICLRILQLFDADISDILILKNEQTNRPIEYIKHRTLGNMPISTYGDGIKKVLLLAHAIVQSADGILLIDEIETAIHAKYYDDIFRFLIKACKQYNVQLFITTHNKETIDALLATQDYEEQNEHDDITVLTLKRGINRTYTRMLPGREVYDNRESFDFEVRL